MTKSFARRAIVCLCVVCHGASGESRSGQSDTLTRSTISVEQRQLALSQLWSEARFSFAYFDTIAADWDARYREFLPRVRDAKTDYEYFLELMRFYAHLHDGHSGVFWPSDFDEALGYPAIEIRKVEGRAVVFRLLRPDDELATNGIRPGVTILTIDGGSVEERLNYWRALKTASTPQATDRLAYFRLLTGQRHSTVDVVVQDPNGTRRSVHLTRSERYFNDTNLDPPQRQITRMLGPGIGYFQANQMHQSVADAFGSFIENTTPLTGLILDLRYNGGGSDAAGFDMLSRLIDRPLDGPVYEVTSYQADRRAVREPPEVIRTQPKISPARGKRFTGPLVVLIGEQTHSATESGFLAAIRARKESLLVGEPTAGSTGQPLVFPLAGGGIGAVCSRRSLASDGSPFVGIGFTPDIRIDLTSADLASGSDGALEKALAALRAGLSR